MSFCSNVTSGNSRDSCIGSKRIHIGKCQWLLSVIQSIKRLIIAMVFPVIRSIKRPLINYRNGIPFQSNFIMITGPCNVYPLTPHFYIVKFGFTSSIPDYFQNSEPPLICYKYNKPIRHTIFNFNKLVSDLDIHAYTPSS